MAFDGSAVVSAEQNRFFNGIDTANTSNGSTVSTGWVYAPIVGGAGIVPNDASVKFTQVTHTGPGGEYGNSGNRLCHRLQHFRAPSVFGCRVQCRFRQYNRA